MHHQIFCVKCFYEDCSAKHTLKVLKQGHCDRVKVHHEQVKDRQTIMGTDSRLCGMIGATESKWAQSSYQGQPHHSDQQPSDIILYGGSYLCWWNGGEERVQSTTDPKNGRFRHMSRARQTSAYTHTYTQIQGQKQHKWKDSPIHSLSVKVEHLSHSITALTQSKIHLIKIGSVQFCSNRISHQWKLWSWLKAQCDTCDCYSFTLTGDRCVRLCT